MKENYFSADNQKFIYLLGKVRMQKNFRKPHRFSAGQQ
jgi:hypothetical protein